MKRVDNMNKKITLVLLMTLLLSVILCGCGNNKIMKILEENGYNNIDNTQIEEIIELESNIQGLDEGKNKLILLHTNNGFSYGIINETTREIYDFSFGYTPLNIIQKEIWNDTLETNKKCFEIVHSYIKENGIDCFNKQDIAEKYLVKITGQNGVIDTEIAQETIKNSLYEIFPNIETAEESDVIFENGTANPIYYAVKSKQLKYQWNRIFTESVYKVWEANTDLSTQRTMKALYGEPYVLSDIWAVVDKNLKEVGTFTSLETFKQQYSNEINKKTDYENMSKKSVITFEIVSNEKTEDINNIVKNMLSYKLEMLGYEVNIDTNKNEIQLTLQYLDDIKSVAKSLQEKPKLTFTDYNDNIMLSSEDIENVVVERNEQINDDNNYYVEFIFSDNGAEKFREATSVISKYENPNNILNIKLDNTYISSPQINQEINSKSCSIQQLSQSEAEELMNKCNSSIFDYSLNLIKAEYIE